MSTIATMDEINKTIIDNPGMQLSNIRQQKGYTIEYVASKLHLRVRIIELIEQGEFNLLPQPVFIKGYLRAYSKLLGVSPEPFLAVFNEQYVSEKKPERTLWQSKRESHKAEHVIRWFTILFALGVIVAVGFWWGKNRDTQPGFLAKEHTHKLSLNEESPEVNSELKLTDLSKMEALLMPSNSHMSPMEKKGA